MKFATNNKININVNVGHNKTTEHVLRAKFLDLQIDNNLKVEKAH
jgi:hypothetical protein